MATQTQRLQRSENGGLPGSDAGPFTPVVEGMARLGTSIGDAYAAMGQEWLSFLSQRWHEDFALSQRLVTCVSPQDVARVWSEFFNAAAKAYQDEWQRLAQLGQASMVDIDSAMHRDDVEREAGSRRPH